MPRDTSPALSSPLNASSLAQDGSCNGLQHYAALGRDSVGAASVNLVPSDLPQDVYSGVATQVGTTAPQPILIPKSIWGLCPRNIWALQTLWQQL